MNVLLIGGGGHISDAILEKFNKEGDRIYCLSGNEHKKVYYSHVFEQYSFSYESGSVKEIFESVNPDITIFMGAYDTNFKWENDREEAVHYSAGLLNVLMAYSLVKRGRFIYLSSDVVFNDSYPSSISEEIDNSARSFKAMVIAQGEDLCKKYQQFDGLDIAILRMDHLYGMPGSQADATDICSKMCIQALRKGVVEANANNEFSLLYIADAVDFLYQISTAKELGHSLYHLGSENPMNEMDLAKLIQQAFDSNISIQDNTIGSPYRIILSSSLFASEFNGSIFNPPEKTVPKMVAHIRWNKKKFINPEEDNIGFFKRFMKSSSSLLSALLPFVENVILFIPAFMANNRAVGSLYFSKLDFYLLYVLFFAIIYGQQQATFSAILAVAGYFFRQMYTRTGFEVLMDFNTYVWIAQLFIVGLVVGRLKDQLAVIKKEDKDELSYLSGQINDIQDINTSNVRIKNVMEEQIVNHNQSIGKIYEITSELEQYAPEEVMFYAAEVIARLLDSKDVAIYTVANSDYARLFSSTSPRARVLGNTVKYSDMKDMYVEIMQHRVFMNTSLTEDYPLMASGIYEEDHLQIIIMVWGISWSRMNLSLSNLLIVTGYLIQNAVLRANRYQKALEHERFIPGTRILEADAFTSLVKAYLSAQQKGLTECALVSIPVDAEGMTEAATEIIKKMRSSDYIGEFEDHSLYALLSNTDKEGAEYVIGRFEEAGYTAELVEEIDL